MPQAPPRPQVLLTAQRRIEINEPSAQAIAGCCAAQARPVVSAVCRVEAAGREERRVPRYSRRLVAGPWLVDTANAVLQADVSAVGTSHQTGRSTSGASARNALRPRASCLRSSVARTRSSRTPFGLRLNSGRRNAKQGNARGRFAADFSCGGARSRRAQPSGKPAAQARRPRAVTDRREAAIRAGCGRKPAASGADPVGRGGAQRRGRQKSRPSGRLGQKRPVGRTLTQPFPLHPPRGTASVSERVRDACRLRVEACSTSE
jgi:hypothetical protein